MCPRLHVHTLVGSRSCMHVFYCILCIPQPTNPGRPEPFSVTTGRKPSRPSTTPTNPPTGTNKRKRLLIHMPCHDHACFMLASPPAKLCFPHANTTVPKQNKHRQKHRNVQPTQTTRLPNFRQQQLPRQSTQHAPEQQQHTR